MPIISSQTKSTQCPDCARHYESTINFRNGICGNCTYRKWRNKNLEWARYLQRRKYYKNRKKANELSRKAYYKNREERKRKQREYYWAHKKERNDYNKKWAQKNRDKLKEYLKWYSHSNKPGNIRAKAKNSEYMRRHREKEPYKCAHRLREAKRRAIKKKTAVIQEKILISSIKQNSNWMCEICGKEVEKNSYEIDHRIPLRRGGAHTEDNLRIVHKRCNRMKRALLDSELFVKMKEWGLSVPEPYAIAIGKHTHIIRPPEIRE